MMIAVLHYRQGRQLLLDFPLPIMDVLLHLIESNDDDIAKHSALCLSNLVMDQEGKSEISWIHACTLKQKIPRQCIHDTC